MRSRYPRLSLADRGNLSLEVPGLPVHIGGLAVVSPGPLVDARGEPDLGIIERGLERRLGRVPVLRRVVRWPPPLCGPPLWVDDPGFRIDRHVRTAPVRPPGGEAELLEAAGLALRPLLDRSHPLWELWLLTGLEGGRLGVLFKLHHAIADGLAAVALMGALFDLQPDAADPPAEPWTPQVAPTARALLADNLRGRAAAVASTVRHPLRLGRAAGLALLDSARLLGRRSAAPRTSLNRPLGDSRRIRVLHLDLEEVRAAAHARGARVNDAVLSIVAGGLRQVLLARGEPVAGVELEATVLVALRSAAAARELGNAAGAILVPLPVGEDDAARRLAEIAAATRSARAEQRPAYVQGLMALLAATGLARPFAERQRMVNVFVTNVPGPPVPVYFLGSRIEDMTPITGLSGNVTVTFAVFSYCGRLDLVAHADAAAWPDIDVLAAGLRRAWSQLAPLAATRPVAR